MITFIILTRGHPDFLSNCLKYLSEQTWSCWNVIVIDTTKQSEGLSWNKIIIDNYKDKVEYIEYCSEPGFAVKNNMGIEDALKNKDCKFVCLLNDDAYIAPEFVEKMITMASKYKDAYAFSPLYVYANKIPETIQVMGGSYFNEECPCGENQLSHDVQLNMVDPFILSSPRYIDCGYGAAIVYKREVFDKIGFLDPVLKHGFDEPDFAKRMNLQGLKVLYVPTIVKHVSGGSATKKWYKSLHTILPMTYGRLYFLLKHYPVEFVVKKEIEYLKQIKFKPKTLLLELYSIVWNIFHAIETRGDYHDLYDPEEPSKFEKEELAKKGMPWKRVKLPFKLRLLDKIISYSFPISLLIVCIILYTLGQDFLLL